MLAAFGETTYASVPREVRECAMTEKTLFIRGHPIADLVANLWSGALEGVEVVQVRDLRRVLNPREELLGRDNPDLNP